MALFPPLHGEHSGASLEQLQGLLPLLPALPPGLRWPEMDDRGLSEQMAGSVRWPGIDDLRLSERMGGSVRSHDDELLQGVSINTLAEPVPGLEVPVSELFVDFLSHQPGPTGRFYYVKQHDAFAGRQGKPRLLEENTDISAYDRNVRRDYAIKRQVEEFQQHRQGYGGHMRIMLDSSAGFYPMDRPAGPTPGDRINRWVGKMLGRRRHVIQGFAPNAGGSDTQKASLVLEETDWGQIPIDLQRGQPRTRWGAVGVDPDLSGYNDGVLKESVSEGDGANKQRPTQLLRTLLSRHLQMIALGGTVGVGLLLASGKAFSTAGPLGTVLGFTLLGFIVLCTMLLYCEMVTFIPLAGGLSGISLRFVDDAFGFSMGFIYWLSYTMGFPTEVVAGVIMLSYYDLIDVPGSPGQTAGFIALFLVLAIGANLLEVLVYGEVEYTALLIKVILLIAWIIFMIVLNAGGVAPHHTKLGFTYWNTHKSDPASKLWFGPFRPKLDTSIDGGGKVAVSGDLGRFLQVIVAAVVAGYCYVGTEIVLIAAGEAKAPREALPRASRSIFWKVGLFYVLGLFVVGLNLYAGDPRLLRFYSQTNSHGVSAIEQLAFYGNATAPGVAANYAKAVDQCDLRLMSYAGFSNGLQLPWVIALQGAGLCGMASLVNALLVFFLVLLGASQLYAALRTLYYMLIQNKAPRVFLWCSARGVPYMLVLFTGLFGLMLMLVCNLNAAVVFQRFLSICSTAGLLVWLGMCFAFVRFYYGMKRRPDLDRNAEWYPYRLPFQPYLAICGCVGALILVCGSGFVVFLKDHWDVSFFISCYGCPMIVAVCYVAYKVVRRTRIRLLDAMDYDTGRREHDLAVWLEQQTGTGGIMGAVRYVRRVLL